MTYNVPNTNIPLASPTNPPASLFPTPNPQKFVSFEKTTLNNFKTSISTRNTLTNVIIFVIKTEREGARICPAEREPSKEISFTKKFKKNKNVLKFESKIAFLSISTLENVPAIAESNPDFIVFSMLFPISSYTLE